MKNKLILLFIAVYSITFAQEPDRFSNIQLLNINSEQAEFGVSFYKNNLVLYASSQKDKTLKRKDRSHNRMQYLEFYKGLIGNSGQLIPRGKYSSQKFNMFHEADITFTPDGKSIYFTLNNYINDNYRNIFNKQTDKKNILNIFKADIDDNGIASNIEPVPFNGKNYSVKNPELSPDGKTLYFSSDMEGGYGYFDIYKVAINNDGTYGDPENLGSKINTKYNEFFPFLSTNNIFYFSSDGHGGAGYLDIFSSKYEDGKYKTPQNVDPVNSEYDDFAFVISPEKEVGYFSSTRKGRGNADIYSFTIDPLKCNQLITGIVRNKSTNKVVSNATVKLFSNNELLDVYVTKEDGAFKFKSSCQKNYTLTSTKNRFSSNSQDLTTSNIDGDKERVTLYIDPIKCNQTVAGIVASKETNTPIANVELSLSYKGDIIEITTSKIGGLFKFNTQIKCDSKYSVITNAKNYLPKTETFTTSDELNGENYLEIKLEETKEFITLRNIKMIRTKPIYFDLNKSNIRVDAAIELDKVVTIMNKYPDIKIELNSHTDSRAPDDYNMKLSQDRAASSIAYIISKGIDPSRISGRGYGETQLVNKCSNGVKCTEAEHQENRRTEFIVINE